MNDFVDTIRLGQKGDCSDAGERSKTGSRVAESVGSSAFS
jgi:hypothetical protein